MTTPKKIITLKSFFSSGTHLSMSEPAAKNTVSRAKTIPAKVVEYPRLTISSYNIGSLNVNCPRDITEHKKIMNTFK